MAFTPHSSSSRRSRLTISLGRLIGALGLTLLLLVFLITSQWITPKAQVLSIRAMDSTTESAAQPAPPPPPPNTKADIPPPPPPPPPAVLELPKLDLSVSEIAPPIQATLAQQDLNLALKPAEFSKEYQPPKAANLFSSYQLDGQPRLLNRPSFTFPSQQRRWGVTEGRVTLEVIINAGGRVSVRRVISSSHPDFIPEAKRFATRARFSPPIKDGRVVNALFQWPIVMR